MAIELTEIIQSNKFLDITWQVSNFCNFKCSYCNPGNYIGTERNDSNLEGYINSLQTITDRYKSVGYKNFKFFFSGGEPTLWKNLIPICKWVRENLPNSIIAINTNLSVPLSFWKKNYEYFDDIVGSFHVEFSDKEKYLNNAMFLHNKMNYFSCKMLMHEERFWEVVEFGELLKTKLPNYFIEWTPLFDEMSRNAQPWEYKDKEKQEFLNNHTIDKKRTVSQKELPVIFYALAKWSDDSVTDAVSNEIIIKRQNFFKGWECSIGDSIWIDQSGYVSMGTCGQVGKLGHMLSDIRKIGPRKITCRKEHCHCGTDILIPKVKKVNE